MDSYNPGRVYVLANDEIREIDARQKLRHQKACCVLLKSILDATIVYVEDLDFPLGWPVKGFDRESCIATLRDMIPTQTEAEMVAESYEDDA